MKTLSTRKNYLLKGLWVDVKCKLSCFSLKYADRAKKIKINLKKNVLNVDFHVAQYVKIVEDLRGEISQLKERIQELEQENSALKTSPPQTIEDMEVVPATAHSAEEPSEEERAKKEELETLRKTLSRYIERQKDYDDLVKRVEEFEKLNEEQEMKMEKLKVESEEIVGGKVERNEVLEYQSRIRDLESRLKERADSPAPDERLDSLVEERKNLISKILSEESSLINLKMRINFKKKLEERNVKITIGQKEIEKTEIKTCKAVEALSRKVERKEERLTALQEEIKKNQSDLEAAMSSSSNPQSCKIAQLEIEVLEARAQSRHQNSIISTMGLKLETQDFDLNSTLVVLRKNHVCLRGYDLASMADQKQYDDLRSQLMENRLKWSDALEEYSDQSEPEIQPVQFYSSAARLSLPTLRSSDQLERPRSREENLEDASTASTVVPEDQTVVEATLLDPSFSTSSSTSSSPPPPCRSEKAVFSTVKSPPSFPALPPTANLVETRAELSPPTPRVFGNNSFEILPPTPNLAPTRLAPLIRKASDLSFANTPPAAPLRTGLAPTEVEAMLTPKRVSESGHEDQGAAKKPKLMSQINWAVHRESSEMPVTPQAAATVSRTLNETFDSQSDSPSPPHSVSGLNDTITLETKMVEKCDIQPAEKDQDNMNSTFAVEVSSGWGEFCKFSLIS